MRLNILASERNISFEFANAAQPVEVKGDHIALEQAIGNLVHNAIKFATKNVAIMLDVQDGEAVFEVIDDGPGLAEVDIPKITDRQYRGVSTKAQAGRGLGLGLPIARAIIEQHCGHLTISPLDNHGTRVIVRLPCMDTQTHSALGTQH